MNRPWRIGLIFLACLVVALAGLGWITWTTLKLDHAQAEGERQAAVEENARLALWRLDSTVLPIIMEENARPYYVYSAYFYVQRKPSINVSNANTVNDYPWPERKLSPLIAQDTPYVTLFFQIDPQNQITSPQVYEAQAEEPQAQAAMANPPPPVPQNAPPEPANSSANADQPEALAHTRVAQQADKLRILQQQVKPEELVKQVVASLPAFSSSGSSAPNAAPSSLNKEPRASPKAQQEMNYTDYDNRQQSFKGLANNGPIMSKANSDAVQSAGNIFSSSSSLANSVTPAPASQAANSPQATSNLPQTQTAPATETQIEPQTAPAAGPQTSDLWLAPTPHVGAWMCYPDAAADGNAGGQQQTNTRSGLRAVTTVLPEVSTIQPMWVKNDLLLTRQVTAEGKVFLQGAWVDWEGLKGKLLGDVKDLLPNATLEPLTPAEAASDRMEHRLALLPVRLSPGTVPYETPGGLTPVERTLFAAWLGILVAAVAVAVLLYGVVALSERRAAFVSAVTHELRTPLTTFRMYTEMLSEGMVTDEAKRVKYLDTMRAEAVRLGHLVENVLAYAQLERAGHGARAKGGRMETLTVVTLVGRMLERLGERAEQAQMEFKSDLGGVDQANLRADPAAVEQILFNLVDNACKYGTETTNRRIELSAGLRGGAAVLTVRDFGTGISEAQRTKLFQPFSRSAQEAANSQTRTPGVGLGLALSRRLARAMGGELRLVPPAAGAAGAGACFELSLPLA